MDFNFTAEQEMLRDSVSRYLGDRYDFAQPPGHDPLGAGLAARRSGTAFADELGILGASFAEATRRPGRRCRSRP